MFQPGTLNLCTGEVECSRRRGGSQIVLEQSLLLCASHSPFELVNHGARPRTASLSQSLISSGMSLWQHSKQRTFVAVPIIFSYDLNLSRSSLLIFRQSHGAISGLSVALSGQLYLVRSMRRTAGSRISTSTTGTGDLETTGESSVIDRGNCFCGQRFAPRSKNRKEKCLTSAAVVPGSGGQCLCICSNLTALPRRSSPGQEQRLNTSSQ